MWPHTSSPLLASLDGLSKEEESTYLWNCHYLSSPLALPRDGHLEAVVHVMAYVGQKYDTQLVYYPTFLEIKHNLLKICNWIEFHWC